MRIRLSILALLLALLAPTAAWSQASMFVCIGPPAIGACQPVSATNPFPVSGTFTPSGTSPEFTPIAPATATATKGVLLGTQYNSTQATFTDGQQGALQSSSRGELKTNIFDSAGNARGANVSAANELQVGSGTLGTAANQSAIQAPVAPATATATKSVLLGAQATTAAVNPTTGQQSALSSDTNNNLLVSTGGAPNLTIAQVSVTTSDTAVVSARALRRSVTVQQVTGTQNVFCNQTTATAGNGVVLPPVVGASFTFNTTSAIRCIAISSTQTVAIAETF